MTRWLFALVTVLCLTTVRAQETVPKPQAPAVPKVSAETKLQLEVIALKQQLALTTAQLQVCQSQVAPEAYKNASTSLQGDIARVVAEFEKTNPGWTLDLTTMQPKKKGGD